MTDLLREGIHGLLAHRVRSLLSALGILFGVGAVIGILSIGEGARRETELLVERLGIQNFQVRAVEIEGDDEQATEVARRSPGLGRRDLRALQQALPLATGVGGLRILEVDEFLPRPTDATSLRVVGADPAYLQAVKLEFREGRPLTLHDERTRAPVAVVGTAARDILFGKEGALGRRLRVGRTWVTVVGVFSEPGQDGRARVEGLDLDDRNRDVVVPLATALSRFPRALAEPELSEILVALPDRDAVAGQARLADRVLARLHRGQPDYALTVPLELLEQSRAQQRIFNLVMGLIAGISLLVGGIGIMNIMLASVFERTREVGVRMAVGAAPRDVLLLFLCESSLISLTGGVLGILAGHGIAQAVAAFTGWATAVSPFSVILAAVISMAEGVIFGLIPARNAASLPPALAVRR